GKRASAAAGRGGRGTSPPLQFGQRPASTPSAQARQNVHSKEQIIASVASGGRSRSQHTQAGRISSIHPRLLHIAALWTVIARSCKSPGAAMAMVCAMSGDAEILAALDTAYQLAVKHYDVETMDRILLDDFALVLGNGTVIGKAQLLAEART